MKLSIQALVTSTAVVALFFIGTGMAHADKGGSKGAPSGGSKMGSSQPHQSSKFHQNSKSNYLYNKGCYPSFWNYGWNFSFCNRFYTYPIYDTCYLTPLVYTYQVPVVTTKVIEVVQPASVVERVITTHTATIVKPRVFHTYSAFRP